MQCQRLWHMRLIDEIVGVLLMSRMKRMRISRKIANINPEMLRHVDTSVCQFEFKSLNLDKRVKASLANESWGRLIPTIMPCGECRTDPFMNAP